MKLRMHQLLSVAVAIICAGLMNAGPTWGVELKGQCIEDEREALLKFKEGFRNTSNRLSSWTSGGDCCKWEGVSCNSSTGHVFSLDVNSWNSRDTLRGEISSSLLGLPYLTYLDLSHNDFMKTQVPEFLGSLHHLEHLNLTYANFSGTIPYHLGKLSHLQSLDLSWNGLSSPQDWNHSLTVNNLDWLHGLSSLKKLDLSFAKLSSAENWHHVLNMLPSLEALLLAFCQLSNFPLSLPFVNITSLEVLDLSGNYFNVTMPDWLFESGHRLELLELRHNKFQGKIPDKFQNMKSLFRLDISSNNLIGSIPSTLCQLASQRNSLLEELDLSLNLLNDTLENCLVQLSGLVDFDITGNKFDSVITDAHLDKLSNIKYLRLSSNHLTINVKKEWVPSFQLEVLYLSHCQLGPEFPRWLQSQQNITEIDISDANISDAVPDWFWNLFPSFDSLNLSHNHLTGFVPDLSPNSFIYLLDLSQNNFFGPISFVCALLSVNNILRVLDLSLNNLSGNIPNCWTDGLSLETLNLANNHFSGRIPNSFGSLVELQVLSLGTNKFTGKIPLSLKNCQSLVLLDLGHNQLSGTVPSWIGEEFHDLRALFLSYNALEGYIPPQLCYLEELRILDLSMNQLSGVIPHCIFPKLAIEENALDGDDDYSVSLWDNSGTVHFYDSVLFSLIWKRNNLVYSRHHVVDWALDTLKIIDLSANILTGDIPNEITCLVALKSLNLSKNRLTGSLPSNIGEMKSLEALDLSWNQLSGSIPESISIMDELQVWNVSYNNLSGEIPSGRHLDTFDTSSYMGNSHLCGHPLTFTCREEESLQDPYHRQVEAHGWDWKNIHPFYKSITLGFITGFWGLWGSLLFSRSWRHAYFHFLSHICDKLYVMTAVVMAKLRRKF